MPANPPTAVFVYGTLKRGQCRESNWPRKPTAIQIAWTRGYLFDRHDYPAVTAGDDRVLGELWRFDVEMMPQVLLTLDQIEGTNQSGQANLYCRVVVEVFSDEDRSLGDAYIYHYATDPTRDAFTRVTSPDESGFVRWPT